MPNLPEAESPDGDRRPLDCSQGNPSGPSHTLLWLTPTLAVCAEGGHKGVVWEHVFDTAMRKFRLKYHHNPVAFALGQEIVRIQTQMLGLEERWRERAGAPP